MRTINFKYFSLLEYANSDEMDMGDFLDTIDNETDVNILTHLLKLIYSKRKYQNELDDHFSDDKNMLKFPIELAKEEDEETLEYIDKLITKRINDIKDNPFVDNEKSKKKKDKYPKLRQVGFKSKGEEQGEISKLDIETAYKRTSKDSQLGFNFKNMESFKFFEAKKKKKNPKRELDKYRSKLMRDDRIKSGAKLGTKVVPDKKKTYKRNKKVDLDKD